MGLAIWKRFGSAESLLIHRISKKRELYSLEYFSIFLGGKFVTGMKMEPMRVVFWDRDSLGRKQNLAELYVGYYSQAHKERNTPSPCKSTFTLRGRWKEKLGEWDLAAEEVRQAPDREEIANFSLPLPRAKTREQLQGNSLVRSSILHPRRTGLN